MRFVVILKTLLIIFSEINTFCLKRFFFHEQNTRKKFQTTFIKSLLNSYNNLHSNNITLHYPFL